MDSWPNINAAKSASSSSRPGTATLPAPGSVVMASVDEDLGDGRYALRWGQNRIAVNSQTPLRAGQSLILRSELSAEGKITLVVQGPAIPDPGVITGRVIYHQGKPHAGNQMVDDGVPEQPPAYGPGGKTGQEPGNAIAAGVSQGKPSQPQPSPEKLIGLVLEPLPELQESVAVLEAIVREERGGKAPLAAPAKPPPARQEALASTPVLRLPPEAGGQVPAAPDTPARAPGERPPPPSSPQNGRPEAPPAPSAPPSPAPASTLPAEAGPRIPVVPEAPSRPPAEPVPPPQQPPSPPPSSPQSGRPEAPPAPSAPPSPTPASTLPAEAGPRIPVVPEAPSRPPAEPSPPPPPSPPPSSSQSGRPETPPAPSAPPSPAPASTLPAEAGPRIPVVPETPSRPPAEPAPPFHTYPARHNPYVKIADSPPPESPASASRQPPAPAETAPPPPVEASPRPATGRATEIQRREILAGIAKASEVPVQEFTDAAAPAKGAKIPDAVVDKAAAIFLRAAGLTPDAATLEVAAALVRNTVAVDRETVQALMALAANAKSVSSAEAIAAAARLAAKDIPLAQPLVSGLAQVMARTTGTQDSLANIMTALAPGGAPPEAEIMMAGARELLDMLHVDLDSADAPQALERYVSTFGRETLAKAMAMVEVAAQAVLENHPALQNIDAALARILPLLEGEIARFAQHGGGTAGQPAQALPSGPAAPAEQAETPPLPGITPPPAGTAAQNAAGGALPENAAPPPLPASPLPPRRPPEAEAPPSPTAQPDAPPAKPEPAAPPRIRQRINAYLNAPRALPLTEMLKNLPPMPQLVRIGDAVPQQAAPAAAAPAARPEAQAATPQTPVATELLPPPTANRPVPQGEMSPPSLPARLDSPVPPQSAALPPAPPPAPQQAAPLDSPAPKTENSPVPQGEMPLPPPAAAGRESAAAPRPEAAAAARPPPSQATQGILPEREGSALLMKLDSLFQTPGLNKAEFDLLSPGGVLERFLHKSGAAPAGQAVQREAERLFRELSSQSREIAEKAQQELPEKEPEVLRETAARLTRREGEIIRESALLNRLSEAANSLRELGRQGLAVKAENVAGMERNPGVMLAEVPLKLQQDAGDGRMQMFYRRGQGKQEGWSSRVILDLNTTRMGAVLGDLRFFGQEMSVNIFVEAGDVAAYLEESAAGLAELLVDKGFRVKTRIMVMPAASGDLPQIRAERPEIAGEEAGVLAAEQHRLDIKG